MFIDSVLVMYVGYSIYPSKGYCMSSLILTRLVTSSPPCYFLGLMPSLLAYCTNSTVDLEDWLTVQEGKVAHCKG